MKHQIFHTLFTGRRIIELKDVDSTNSYAAELIRNSAPPEGTVVSAQIQLHGRGQRSAGTPGTAAMWESELYKNITVSIVFYPRFLALADRFLFNQAMALGVYDYVKSVLTERGEEVKIKWPNDIYFNDRKLAGMLIENTLRTGSISSSIVGIGLNINQTVFRRNISNPSSFKLITGREYDLEKCLTALCSSIEPRYLQLKAKKAELLQDNYLCSLYRFNKFHFFESNHKKFKAKITGVSKDGKLMLEHENGENGEYDLKEVRYLH